MPARKKTSSTKNATANLGFEAKLWLAADKLRNNMDAAEPERSGDSQPQAARRASKAKNNMVVLPGQLFYSTQIPICLWFLGKNNTLDLVNDVHLFDGEAELSLVA